MSPARTDTPAPTPWGLVILLGALTAFAPMSIDMYLPSLPTLAAELGASAGQGQATVAAFLAGMAVGQLFYGPASDRIGRRKPILFGVVLYALATIACASAGSIEALTASRFVQALGGCAGAVVARAIVRDRFDHVETARVLSLLTLVMGLAPILAPLLGGLVLQVAGWRAIFWTLLAFGVVMALAVWFRLPESRSEAVAEQARSERPIASYLALLRSRRLVGYVLAGALNGATLFTYIASSPGLLIDTYGISPAHFGWVFGLNAAGMIAAGQINRILLRWRRPDEVLAVASLVAVLFGVLLCAALITGAGGRLGVLALLFVLLSTYGFMQGNTMAGALNADPLRAGSVSALMGAASFATGALASSLAGALHAPDGRSMGLIMLVSLAGSAAALHLMALRPGRAPR